MIQQRNTHTRAAAQTKPVVEEVPCTGCGGGVKREGCRYHHPGFIHLKSKEAVETFLINVVSQDEETTGGRGMEELEEKHGKSRRRRETRGNCSRAAE